VRLIPLNIGAALQALHTALLLGALAVSVGASCRKHASVPISVTVNGNGKVISSPSGINCPGNCVASFESGTSVALHQSTSRSFIGWRGACNGTGSCLLTMSSEQSVTAIFEEGSQERTQPKATWSVSDQQPVTQVFYPGTLWTTPLPADVGNHCLTNVPCTSSDPGTAIVSNIFSNSDTLSYNSISILCLDPSGCPSSNGNAFYYSSQEDPIFRVNAGSGPCPTGPNATSANCAAGKYFHMPSGAQWDAAPRTQSDQGLLIWDQSTDIDSTPGGRIVGSYFSGGGIKALPTNCTATRPAQADAQSACQLSWYHNSVNFPFHDSRAWGNGLSSDGAPNGAAFVREQEIMQGAINHALGLDTACLRSSSGNGVADPPIFPATANAAGCTFVDNLRPLNGNLFWIDFSYNCNTLPPWQKPICGALQRYGGYVHATAGGNQVSLVVLPVEGGMAHKVKGVNDTFFNNWIIANSNLTCPAGGYPKTCTGYDVGGQVGLFVLEDSVSTSEKVVALFMQMPGLIRGHHLHIVDPCIPKRMAGQPGAC
jgi:hypothetical protein